jgi:cytochrome c oxidase subunit III
MQIPYTSKPRPDTGLYNAKVGLWLFLASEFMLFGGLFSAYILLRAGQPEGLWPRGWLNVPIGTINTLVLITSSISATMAWAACKMGQFTRYKMFQGLTILLAVLFLGVKSYEYRDKLSHYWVETRSGMTVDGHLVEKSDSEIVLHGVKTDDAEVLYDRTSPAYKKLPHEEIRIKTADIKKISNYAPRLNIYLGLYWTITGLHALHLIGGILVFGYLWGPGSGMWKRDPERFTNRVEIAGLYWHFVDLVWVFVFPVLYLF